MSGNSYEPTCRVSRTWQHMSVPNRLDFLYCSSILMLCSRVAPLPFAGELNAPCSGGDRAEDEEGGEEEAEEVGGDLRESPRARGRRWRGREEPRGSRFMICTKQPVRRNVSWWWRLFTRSASRMPWSKDFTCVKSTVKFNGSTAEDCEQRGPEKCLPSPGCGGANPRIV
jgi:hypothetical protein